MNRIAGNASSSVWNVGAADWNVPTGGKEFSSEVHLLIVNYDTLTLVSRIYRALRIVKYIYYPILAVVGVPVNLMAIHILSRGKCGLSKCITRYLATMAAADLLVIIIDLMLRHIPIIYQEHFYFLYSIPVCNIHAILLYTVTDCSVWFTVAFSFDRFVAICCLKLKCQYCTEKTQVVVLGTLTIVNFSKNIFWYFMLTERYLLGHSPWFCAVTIMALLSQSWIVIETIHYILNPCIPFVLILLLNALTVRHILMASRARTRLKACSNKERPRDPEIENRRKSIILLFVISANFILLWAMLMVYSIWYRMSWLGYSTGYLHEFVQEMGFMLQLLSCCTNTGIYAVTQTKFRLQLKHFVTSPFFAISNFIK